MRSHRDLYKRIISNKPLKAVHMAASKEASKNPLPILKYNQKLSLKAIQMAKLLSRAMSTKMRLNTAFHKVLQVNYETEFSFYRLRRFERFFQCLIPFYRKYFFFQQKFCCLYFQLSSRSKLISLQLISLETLRTTPSSGSEQKANTKALIFYRFCST